MTIMLPSAEGSGGELNRKGAFGMKKKSLIMLVCAFAGKELIMEAYRQAVEQRYRFFSYGDCMLIV